MTGKFCFALHSPRAKTRFLACDYRPQRRGRSRCLCEWVLTLWDSNLDLGIYSPDAEMHSPSGIIPHKNCINLSHDLLPTTHMGNIWVRICVAARMHLYREISYKAFPIFYNFLFKIKYVRVGPIIKQKRVGCGSSTVSFVNQVYINIEKENDWLNNHDDNLRKSARRNGRVRIFKE